MKKLLIFILTLCSISGFSQILIDPNTGSITTTKYNTAIQGVITVAGTDTYTASGYLGVSSYTGLCQTFQFANANTGTATLNVNGIGAVTIKKQSGGSLVNLSANDIGPNERKDIYFDGTFFVIKGGIGSGTTGALIAANNLSDLANASTARTNLGLGTAATISSTAGGDLSGTLPNPTVTKINGTTLSVLTTGILKNTTSTGVPSIAVAGTDYQAPITFGIGVQTALGVNIGSAGAPVLFNGAGGSPASITLPSTAIATTQSPNTNNTTVSTTAYSDAKVADAINDGTTTISPSQNAVFDALALKKKVIQAAFSDQTTAITAGTNKVTFRMPYGMTISEVRISLKTAQASGTIFTVDINENGTTILSTKLTIDNTERTSVTAITPAVISDSSLADDSEMTIDVDQVGDGSAVAGIVTIIGL